MATLKDPLTEEDLAQMKERLTELDQVDVLITKMRNAGIPVENQTTKAREVREQILKLKQSFFPGQ